MSEQKRFDMGLFAGMLLTLAASSGNWLITPQSHPDASALRVGMTIAQAVLCAGAAALIIARFRRRVALSSAA
ncbi:hypothetical protein D3C83_09390 [compost metagenome]